MIDFGTVAPTSLLTTHIKVLQQNEGKTEIGMSHSYRKWNYRAHAESVAACAQKQRRQKTNKDNRNMKGYKQVAIVHLVYLVVQPGQDLTMN